MQVAATPPNAVSLNSIGSPLPTLYIASTVSSNGIIFNIPAKHNSADIKAFATPIAFLPVLYKSFQFENIAPRKFYRR